MLGSSAGTGGGARLASLCQQHQQQHGLSATTLGKQRPSRLTTGHSSELTPEVLLLPPVLPVPELAGGGFAGGGVVAGGGGGRGGATVSGGGGVTVC